MILEPELRDRIIHWLRQHFAPGRPILRHLILGGILISLLFVLLSLPGLQGLDIQAGKASPLTVQAPRTIEFADRGQTEELRNQRRNTVQRIYRYHPAAEIEGEERLSQVFAALDVDLEAADRQEGARSDGNTLPEQLSPTLLRAALQLTPAQINAVRESSTRLVRQLYADGVHDDRLAEEKQALGRRLPAELAPAQRILAIEALSVALIPNWLYDRAETERLRDKAAEEVAPVTHIRMAGETIVEEGELVTGDQVAALRELGLLHRGLGFGREAGIFLFSTAVIILAGIFLGRFRPKVYESSRLTLLLGLVALLTVVLSIALRLLMPNVSPFVTLTPTAGILAAILFDPQLAVLAVLASALSSGLALGSSESIIMGIGLGLFSVFVATRITDRKGLVRAGVLVALAAGYISLTISLVGEAPAIDILRNVAYGFIGGAGAAVAAAGLLPFLESVFVVTTDLHLLELSNPNHPLLKDLMLKAPGTWSHSVMAANLAASAAEAVKANVLLCRVGAYFHDVGKMRRPFFFIENNFNQSEGHDKINPTLSCLVITSHVKEGVEMAKTHRLPEEVIQIIEQHHGSGVVSYFYNRAKEEIVKERVYEDAFRYPGKPPETKEAALVMLADSVEAAARSITKPSLNRLEHMCRQIIETKLADGQLDACELTLGELRRVEKIFAQVLASIYHSRIEYPDMASMPRSQTPAGKPSLRAVGSTGKKGRRELGKVTPLPTEKPPASPSGKEN